MTSTNVCHLHVHTEYSMLDGAARVRELVDQAVRLGMPALAVTDHGALYGLVDFYTACNDAGIKPILGCELYLARGSRFSKDKADDSPKTIQHITVLAKDFTGYRNLLKLATAASLEGTYYKPRVDMDLLAEHSQGLIGTTGCLNGQVPRLILEGRLGDAREAAGRWQDIFGRDSFFIELQDHGIADQHKVNPHLIELSDALQIPLVATNDLHYTSQADAEAHDVLLCIQTGATVDEPDRFRFDGNEFFLKSREEMEAALPHHHDAIDRTLDVAEMCNVTLSFGELQLPDYITPDGSSLDEHLRGLVVAGAKRRYGDLLSDEVVQRIDYELSVISRMGFPGYFLVVADLVRWAKEKGIRVGPGRGCLTPDSQVWIGSRTKRLDEVAVGEFVMDESGRPHEVTAIHRYPVDEELVRLVPAFGDAITLTKDHQVLSCKTRRETSKRKLAQGYRYETQDPATDLEWRPAGDIDPGDYVCLPIPRPDEAPIDTIDLAGYVPPKMRGVEITDDQIVHRLRHNASYRLSFRSVASETGLQRGTIRRILDGDERVTKSARRCLEFFLKLEGLTIDDWKAHVDAEDEEHTLRIPRFIKVDRTFLYLAGYYLSDGWTTPHRVGFAFHVDDVHYQDKVARCAEKVFNVKMMWLTSTTRKLRQGYLGSIIIARLFRDLFPGKAKTKQIPDYLASYPLAELEGLIEGLWDGDGHIGDRRGRYTTVSKDLALRLKYVLLRFGIPAKVQTRTHKDQSSWRDTYTLSVPPNPLFERLYGLTPYKKYVWHADSDRIYVRVLKREVVTYTGDVYDLTVRTDNEPSYCSEGFLVHNSAAGTITCYSLGITTLDPIRYGLVFERFLNPERREMPDFDIDFDERYRGEVVTYLRQKYGEDRVAQIITFSTIKGKSGIRDSARVLGYPYGMGDRLAKMFPRSMLGKDPSLKDCFEKSKDSKWTYAYTEAAEMRKAHAEETDSRRVLDAALKLEGLRRQTGVHAAAVVVGREPLVNFTALQRTDQGDVVTQYEMNAIEKLGLLKVDILGLGNLTVIELTLELLRNAGAQCDIDNVPLDDPKVFELLQRGDVDGVFQLESEGMRRLLKSLRPDMFEDIVALIALYRPGPMQEIDKYIAGKHDPAAVRYPHALLEDVLGDTYGVIVYQEQVLQLLQRVAGYTAGEADVVRKAVGKKVESIMKAEEPKFLAGADAQGLTGDQARYLWELIQPFAGYSFNRAHSACYGLIAYQTAYLKAHHPVEYLSALLTSCSDSKDEKTKYLASARKMGVEVLPPDVNLSQLGFAPDPQRPDCVRFGLAGIRNVGEGVVQHIVAARQQAGVFKDFFDFCWRVDVTALNKRTVESMIKAGAFDSMGHQRGGLLEVFEQTVEQIASARRKESEGYVSLFDEPGGVNGDRTLVGSHLRVTSTELPKAVRMAYEKEMLGNYVTDHPLAGLEEVLACQTDTSIAALPEVMDGGTVAIAGIVHKIGKKFTRKGELMFILEVEDLEASCEVIVFPQTAEKSGDLVAIDQVLCIRGRVDHKEDAPKIVAMDLAEPDYSLLDNPLRVRVPAADCTPRLVSELKAVLLDYPGARPVFLHLLSGEKETVLRLGADFRVDPGNGCVDRLRLLLGAEAVTAV